MLEHLFKQFQREKLYLNNLSPKTIKYLGFVFNRRPEKIGQFPDKQNLKEFVIKLSESDRPHPTNNSYIRGWNSF